MSVFPLVTPVRVLNPVLLDDKEGPYIHATEAGAIALANAGVPIGIRCQGQTAVLIIAGVSKKYQWQNGTADTDLVALTTPLPQPLGQTDNPTFGGATFNGSVGISNNLDIQGNFNNAGTSSFNLITGFKATISTIIATIAFKFQIGSYLGSILWSSLTANRTATFPDKNITVAGLDDIDALKGGSLPSDGDTMLKLYNKTVSGFSQETVADTAAKNAYNVTHLPLELFVIDDGDGKWALYKALTTGVGATYIKISDPDLLNAVMTNAQIKAAYEANGNTNAFTDALLTKLNGIATGATSNSTDAYLLDRSHHTGSQLATTISDFATAAINQLLTGLSTASTAAVVPGDSVIIGVGKLQGQATDLYATKRNKLIAFNPQTVAYTLALADIDKKIRFNSATAIAVTIPANAAVAFPIGASVQIRNIGAGGLSFVPAAGVTIHGGSDIPQYMEAVLTYEAADVWGITVLLSDASVIDSPKGFFKYDPVTNTVNFKRTVAQVAGAGNSAFFDGSSRYFSGSDAGFYSGSSGNQSIGFIYRKPSLATINTIFSYGTGTTQFAIVTSGASIQVYIGNSATLSLGNIPNTGYNTYLFSLSGSTWTFYINGVSASSGTGFGYTIATNGVFQNTTTANATYRPYGSFAQLVVWNSSLTLANVTAFHNAGAGRDINDASFPVKASVIRYFGFNDGAPSITIADANPNGTQYPLAYNNYAVGGWGGPGSGIIATAGQMALGQFIKVWDGIYSNEKGQMFVGDPQSGYYNCGITIKDYINGTIIARITGTDGKTIFSDRNISESFRAKSTVDVDGNATIGQGYAGTNAAPVNGLLVQGRTLLGTLIDNLSDILQLGGNLYLALGAKLKIATGTNASIGTASLVNGTVTVNTSAVTASSIIMVSYKTISGVQVAGPCIGTITAGTSFVINSSNGMGGLNTGDNSTVNWWIIN